MRNDSKTRARTFRLSGTLLAGLLCVSAAGSARADGDYVLVLAGSTRGDMSVRTTDGERRVAFRYVDRGRGPEVTSVLKVDSQGLPVSLSVKGVSYLKIPVNEQFRRDGSKASWSSEDEKGEATDRGFYLQHEATSDTTTVLARALLAAPGGKLALLPAGNAGIEKILDHRIGSETISLYAVSGLGFAPTAIWLDRKQDLFFEGNVWMATIRKGHEKEVAELIRLQDEAFGKRESAQAAALARHPRSAVAIRNVRLFDAVRKQAVEGQTVIVRGERIEAVGPAATTAIPAGAEIIEGQGKTLIPGLFDMHVHAAFNSDGSLFIASGVTSVRDLANDMEDLLKRKAAFDEGRLVGPRVFMAGMIDGKGPLAGPTKFLVDTPEEARAAVATLAANGYPQIKLYSSLKLDLVPVLIEAAHARGMRVSGHIPAGMTMEEAVRLGFDEVQHANFWMLNFMGPEITAKTNSMVRFLAVGEHGRELDLSSQKVADFIALLKQRGTVLDPTLTVLEDTVIAEPGQPSSALAAVTYRLPPVVARSMMATGTARNPEERQRNRESFDRLRQFFVKLHDAGVPIVAGTDGVAGLTLPRELEIYVEAGLTPSQALYTATLGAAKVAGAGERLGSIETGKLADLVLIDGDPTTRISDVRKTILVIKNGVLYDPDALFRSVGVSARKD